MKIHLLLALSLLLDPFTAAALGGGNTKTLSPYQSLLPSVFQEAALAPVLVGAHRKMLDRQPLPSKPLSPQASVEPIKSHSISHEEERDAFRHLSEAFSQRMHFEHYVFPDDHPASRELNVLYARMGLADRGRVYVFHSRQENAYVLGNGDAYISDGLLLKSAILENHAAVLRHEAEHTQGEHGFESWAIAYSDNPLKQLGMMRVQEFRADLAMLTGLDEADINPIGALWLLRGIRRREQTRYRKEHPAVPDDDFEHGTPQQREMILRQILRVLPLRNLDPEKTTPWKNPSYAVPWQEECRRLEGELASPSLSNEAFWRALGQLVSARKEGKISAPLKPILKRYIHRKLRGLGAPAEKALAQFLAERLAPADTSAKSTVTLEQAITFLSSHAFENLGFHLMPADILALSAQACTQAARSMDPTAPEVMGERVGELRRLCISAFESEYGLQRDFIVAWDSMWAAALIGILGNVKTVQAELREETISRAEEKVKVDAVYVSEPLSMRQIEPGLLVSFWQAAGADSFNVRRVFDAVCRQAGVFSFRGRQIHPSQKDSWDLFVANFVHNISSLFPSTASRAASWEENVRLLFEVWENTPGRTRNHTELLPDYFEVFSKESPFDLFFRAKGITLAFFRHAASVRRILSRDPNDRLDFLQRAVEQEFPQTNRRQRIDRLISFIGRGDVFQVEGGWQHPANLIGLFSPDRAEVRSTLEEVFVNEPSSSRTYQNLLARFRRWNAISPRPVSDWSRRDESKIDSAVAFHRRLFFRRLASKPTLTASAMLKAASQSILVFPIHPFGSDFNPVDVEAAWMDLQKTPVTWQKLLEIVTRTFSSHKDPLMANECEELLAFYCHGPATLENTTVMAILYEEMIRRSASFEEAFAYAEKYDFLPPAVTLSGQRVLMEERSRKPDTELQVLADRVKEHLLRWEEEPEQAAGLQLSTLLMRYASPDQRLEFFLALLSTGRSDEALKKFLAQRWWMLACLTGPEPASNHPTVHQVLQEVERLGKALEQKAQAIQRSKEEGGESETHRRLLNEYESSKKRLMAAVNGFEHPPVGVDEVYRSVMTLNPFLLQALLYELALEGEGALFEPPHMRRRILQHILEEYVQVRPDDPAADLLTDVIEVIATVPDARDLFYFLSPFLSSLACQPPRTSFPSRDLRWDLTRLYWQEEHRASAALGGPGEWTFTQRLLAAMFESLITERRCSLGTDLHVHWEDAGQSHNLNAAIRKNMNREEAPKEAVLQDKISPVALGIRLGKGMEALGKRLIQLLALFYDISQLSEEERTLVADIYHKLQGQNKVQVALFLKQEAERNPTFRRLYEKIVTIDEFLGGGSIATVYGTTDVNGEEWAARINNPNAKYHAWDLHRFAARILDALIEKREKKGADVNGLKLVRMLLDKAHQWVGREIEDPDNPEDVEAFRRQNDASSDDPQRFQPARGLGWHLRVPRSQGTGTPDIQYTQRVRSDEDLIAWTRDAHAAQPDPVRKTLPDKDAKAIAALIVQNVAFQLLETDRAHSDIHMGQFPVVLENKEIWVLDIKNFLHLGSEREFFMQVLLLASMGAESLVNAVAEHFMGEKAKEPELLAKLQRLVEERFRSHGPEQAVAALLLHLQTLGVVIALEWDLVTKNTLALNALARWAGFDHFFEALVYSPAGDSPEQTMARVFPKTSAALASSS